MTLSFLKSALVFPPIWPGHGSLSMHLVLLPKAFVFSSILPLALPLTFNNAIIKITSISKLIFLSIPALAVLDTLVELTLIGVTVYDLDTSSMLLSGLEVTFIAFPIHLSVETLSIKFVLNPKSLVDITFQSDQTAFSLLPITNPLAFVNGS